MQDQKQQFISAKIKELMATKRYSQNECIAMAYAEQKMQQGGVQNLKDNVELNRASKLEFTNDYAQNGMFVNEADWDRDFRQRQMAQNEAQNPNRQIKDITSDGQWGERKIWHNQRAEWYDGKPVTESDYTKIPYKDWETYKSTPEYKNYKNLNTNEGYALNTMQVGGRTPFQKIPNSLFGQRDFTKEQYFNPAQFPEKLDLTYGQQPQESPLYTQNDYNFNTPQSDFSKQNFNTDAQSVEDYNYYKGLSAKNPADNTYYEYETLNPYGDIGLEESLMHIGENIGKGNAGAATAYGLDALLGAARSGLSGYAGGLSQKRAQEEADRKLYEALPKTSKFQQGGRTNADLLTGNYQGDQENPNVEVEDGEHLLNSETGEIKEAVGEKHDKGGVKVNLPSASEVISDYTKIGAKNAKKFSEEFDIKIGATNTFADVVDKVNKKIGLDDILKRETDLLQKVEKQSKKNVDKATETINDKFLASELQLIEQEKEALKEIQQQVFDEVFAEQEKIPKKGDGQTLLKKEGGYIDDNFRTLAQKYNLSAEDMYAKMNQMEYAQEGIKTSKYYAKSKYNKDAVGRQKNTLGKNISGDISTKEELIARINAQKENLPNTTTDLALENITPEQVLAFQNKYQRYNTAVVSAINSNPFLSDEEKKQAILEAGRNSFDGTEARKPDSVYGDFSSGLGAFSLPLFTSHDRKNYPNARRIGDLIDPQTGLVKAEYANLDARTRKQAEDTYKASGNDILDLGILDVQTDNVETKSGVAASAENKSAEQDRKNKPNLNVETVGLIPNTFSSDRIAPSGVQLPYLQQVALGRKEHLKESVSSGYAENASALNTAYEQTRGMSPEMRAAVSGSLLAQTQENNNKLFAAQAAQDDKSRYDTDVYNLAAMDKENLTNEAAKKQYEREALLTLNNTDRDWRDYYGAVAADRKAQYDYVDRRNIFNQGLNNFHLNGNNLNLNNNPLGLTGESNQTNTPVSTGKDMSERDKELAKLLLTMTSAERKKLQKDLNT